MDILIINGHDYSRFVKNTGYGWERDDLDSDKATRLKNGIARRDRIAIKRKITLEVMGLKRSELAQLDLDLSNDMYVDVTYMDLHGLMTRTFYNAKFSAHLTTTRRDDEYTWKSDPFTLIEV